MTFYFVLKYAYLVKRSSAVKITFRDITCYIIALQDMFGTKISKFHDFSMHGFFLNRFPGPVATLSACNLVSFQCCQVTMSGKKIKSTGK